jgi:hypothetical protein
MTTPLGIRHKNPLCLKTRARNPWPGQTGKDSRGHAIFDDAMYGFAAGASLLWTYQHTHKLQTLRQIFNRWAPPDDTVGSLPGNPANQPNVYASFVAKKCGVSDTAPLALFLHSGGVLAKDLLLRLILAMAHYECGKPWPEPQDAERGIALYQNTQADSPEDTAKPEPPAPPTPPTSTTPPPPKDSTSPQPGKPITITLGREQALLLFSLLRTLTNAIYAKEGELLKGESHACRV